MLKKFGGKLVALAPLATLAPFARAAGTAPDFSSIYNAVDLSTVGTGILAIAAVMILPKVVKWGANKVMSMVRG